MNIIKIAIYLDFFFLLKIKLLYISKWLGNLKTGYIYFSPQNLSYSIYIKNSSLESFPDKTLLS